MPIIYALSGEHIFIVLPLLHKLCRCMYVSKSIMRDKFTESNKLHIFVIARQVWCPHSAVLKHTAQESDSIS